MSNADDDAGLMKRVAAGDRQAFAVLAERHAGRAHAVAVRMTGNREDAEEVVQDALSKVWRHAARFDTSRSAFGTWFHRIVANGCLDRLRRRRPVAANIDAVAEMADSAPTAEAELVMDAEAGALRQAVAALPDKQRLAVVLCYFEDMPQAEAARVLEMNIKALEGLLFRARRSLRTVLDERS